MKMLTATRRTREVLSASVTYFALSIFFFFGLLISRGDVAQQDWGIPLTANAALHDARSLLFAWSDHGFGGITRLWGYPSVPFINSFLAPLGFFGGTEIKLLSVFLIALSGITMYFLARSFGLGYFSSFLSGLFFMTTAVLFDWLMFGWIYYLIGYALLPIMILATKKFLETSDIRFVVINAFVIFFGLGQPTYILVYPLLCFLFVLFESKANLKIILKGFLFIVGSSILYLLTALNVFLTLHSDSFTLYYGNYFGILIAQFQYLSPILNPIRLWGSTFAYQFETYFPKDLILISFMPIVLALIVVLLKSHDRRVLFLFVCYMFVFVSYEAYANLNFLVFNVPYGAVFEAPNIFLAPAALGLALLVGFSHEISQGFIRLRTFSHKKLMQIGCFVVILIIVVAAGVPWWAGQTSGDPIPGQSTKLNLYQMPSGFTQWSNIAAADNEFFVLYVTSEPGRAQIPGTHYFSQMYEGLNGAVFTDVNNLPYVSPPNSTLFINELLNGSTNVSEHWGAYSIKYIVIYMNVETGYNNTEILNRLSSQSEMVKIVNLPEVVVYKNDYARPIVYTSNLNAKVEITYHDPTSYKLTATSTTPYLLTLNQAYSAGWAASVNEVALSDSQHVKDSNGFNGWYINQTGNMTIEIYYQPQTAYTICFLFSTGVIIAMISYLIIATVKHSRARNAVKSKVFGWLANRRFRTC
jgi:hypothetical protein